MVFLHPHNMWLVKIPKTLTLLPLYRRAHLGFRARVCKCSFVLSFLSPGGPDISGFAIKASSEVLSPPVLKPMAPSVQSSHEDNGNNDGKYADVKWEELGFSLTPTDYMYVMKCSIGESFSHGSITPYGNIELSPSSCVLNYGQAIFEGLKAYRKEDGRILIFRPEQNAMRMKFGAERMCMPSPSIEQFVDAVKQTVLANKRWVPPPGKGSMYLRPLLMGSGPSLGVGPSPEYTFLVYASPVGKYHKGQSRLNLLVEENQHRAMVGGTGDVKAIGNYAPVVQPLIRGKAEGFSDVLFLDAATGKYIEEASACNVFVLRGNVILTPAAHGTILPGITRKSIIELARMFGYEVKEGSVPLEALEGADEIFCTGTAVVVTPVGSITYRGKTIKYEAKVESLCQKLYETLTGIQTGRIEDKMGWMVEVN